MPIAQHLLQHRILPAAAATTTFPQLIVDLVTFLHPFKPNAKEPAALIIFELFRKSNSVFLSALIE